MSLFDKKYKTPMELIPAPKMTKRQVIAHLGKIQNHPMIHNFRSEINFECIHPGDVIKWYFTDWHESFKTMIVEDDINWEEFEDLRVEWEKDATVAA